MSDTFSTIGPNSINPKAPVNSINPKIVVVGHTGTVSVSKAKGSSSPITITIHNRSNQASNWKAQVKNANWVNLSPSSGNLASQQQTTLHANVNVSSLPVGTHTVEVDIVSDASSPATVTVNVQS